MGSELINYQATIICEFINPTYGTIKLLKNGLVLGHLYCFKGSTSNTLVMR